MFDKILAKIFGTKHERAAKSLWPMVAEINRIEEEYQQLSEDELKAKTGEFKQRLNDGETVEDLLPEAFAVVKNACRRLVGHKYEVRGHPMVWDMVPYDVQLIGGIALHQGKIAEMATGEGKTLVAVLPLYLNALEGEGAWLVTVNDYLAQRDSEWMGLIYNYLGLSVGVIISDMPPSVRREQYACDITYGTNNEFGFDYLRDNMALSMDEVVQRAHHYAIVDEVDSVLIDEARTPLIISGPVAHSTQKFDEMKPAVEQLVRLQSQFITKLADEIDKDMAQEGFDEWEVGRKLLMGHRGFPKHKRVMKLFQEPSNIRMRQRVENDLLREKKMHELDEELYFSIDERSHVTDLTDKGRIQLTKYYGGDPDLFILPDLPEEFTKIDGDDALSLEERANAKAKIQDIYAERSERVQNVSQLLRAYALYEKDIEYVVQDGKVMIVDEFTGRILAGRRYSDGLHQAIEAKEGVKIERETQTIATITLQNFFRLFKKLAGMTGTAETEENEFWSIYKLEVMVIPTHQPVRRSDLNDMVYRTKREKFNAAIEKIAELHGRRQPVLVGTVTVETSEVISRMLRRKGIPHNVLNARQHQREAEIVAQAGQPGSVTIATNMAGRGTDIKLGAGVVQWQGEPGDKSSAQGGLFILGTERHESRRIDRQLRGRAGRQGDPGTSEFYLSLEDDLMRLFGSDRIAKIMDRLGVEEGEVITHPMITSAISRAQQKVEAYNFSIREHLLKYDDVMNQQRTVVYARRNIALRGGDPEPVVREMIEDYIDFLIEKHTAGAGREAEINYDSLAEDLMRTFLVDKSNDAEFRGMNGDPLRSKMHEDIHQALQMRLGILGDSLLKSLQRYAILRVIDEKWRDHLYAMDGLKEGVGLRAYGQKDPLIEYKKEGFELFQDMLDAVNGDALRIIFRAQPVVEGAERPRPAAPTRTPALNYSHAESGGMAYSRAAQADGGEGQGGAPGAPPRAGKPQPVRVTPQVGRNDPCPCGSGKKYKKCCGATVQTPN
ncbi:MAG: preprotein translocase subunit SecA [Calditrichota bacterium]